ncbi:MAG: Rnf-Nqr domain containing protein [Brevinema sp.]
MSLWDIFFSGLYFENIFIWHAVGLGMIILFSYNLEEAIWVGIRFTVFLLIQSIILILIRPWFDFPGKELFLLITLIGFEMLMSIVIDLLFPFSHLEDSVSGFIRRGDAILPLALATIIAKDYNAVQTIVYSGGIGLGFALILGMITAISINFNFHRLHPRHTYALKLVLLGILSIISY